ncbi:hypothetical protein FNV43_RR25284 [Rhamnella rubrinervis]|uniref:Branchless trichome n=1 Tax=Rhamnella rubrinervis TaxID=2594499 RepID=A0A8K0DPD5_9ROSA|nr:hypothetical protein FNV43_RR25284 [Rhamnella rubrinervis]
MEEVAMMMITTSPENPRNETISSSEPITTSTCSSWKLYENPFYNSHQHHHHQSYQQLQQCQISNSSSSNNKNLHCLHLPLSARKLAASFWDLTFFRPIMESELDLARAQIMELRTELEYERKARKKLESINKRMAKELADERRGREAVERVCAQLAKEISSDKAEISKMKRDMEEERKMMRMSEVLREERVQMKLAEAKIVFEEKLLELEDFKRIQREQSCEEVNSKAVGSFSGKFRQLVLGEKSSCNFDNNGVEYSRESTRSSYAYDNNKNDFVSIVSAARSVLREKLPACNDNINGGVSVSSMAIQKKASPEPENPHIKRGIKGFVEFPRVVRAIGSKSRHWGTKLECQKAQLRILLKQKSPIRSNSLIMS